MRPGVNPSRTAWACSGPKPNDSSVLAMEAASWAIWGAYCGSSAENWASEATRLQRKRPANRRPLQWSFLWLCPGKYLVPASSDEGDAHTG